MQLLQDNAFDLNAFLAEAMGERIARATNGGIHQRNWFKPTTRYHHGCNIRKHRGICNGNRR